MKRDRIDSFARHRLGLKRWHSVIGLRADEQRRVLRMRARNCGSRTGARAVLPLADAGVREADVLDWWKRQPFDLGIPSYAGNCDLCYLKGRAKLIRLIREDPSIADWWIEQEAKVANRTGPDGRACESMKRFRLGETYAELKAAALAHRDLFDEEASVLRRERRVRLLRLPLHRLAPVHPVQPARPGEIEPGGIRPRVPGVRESARGSSSCARGCTRPRVPSTCRLRAAHLRRSR